jgi:peptide chain release factor 2
MSKDEGDEAGLQTIEAEAAKLAKDVEAAGVPPHVQQPGRPPARFLDIQAGAGGTEACDWASMLLRQYLKYAERKGFKATVEDETAGRHRRHQERHHQDRGRLRLWPAAHRNRRAPAGAQEPV